MDDTLTQAVRVTKDNVKIIRWVQTAASKDDDRPVLKGIHIDGAMATADGYRIHVAPTPETLFDLAGQTVDFGNLPLSSTVIAGQKIEGRFPNIDQLVQKAASAPVLTVLAINPTYLIEALQGMVKRAQDAAYIIIHSDPDDAMLPVEVCGTAADGVPLYALIMPMHVYPGAKVPYWRPIPQVVKAETPGEAEVAPELVGSVIAVSATLTQGGQDG